MRRRTENDLSLRSALRQLPKREPPPALWSRIEAALSQFDEPEAPDERSAASGNVAPFHFALAAGLAVLAFLLGVLLVGSPDTSDSSPPGERVVDTPGEVSVAGGSTDFADLLAESARLERALVTLPHSRGVIRVGTAGTIAGLEDHIAWIDAELSASAALDADPTYQEVLWRERVEVMNALVDVRYAQLPTGVLLR